MLVFAGCGFHQAVTGPLAHDSKVIEMGKFEMARFELHMGAGELHIEGGSPKLLEANFDYNVPSWKPMLDANTSSFRADIKISQPNSATSFGNQTCRWDLKLNDSLPTNLIAHLGAGEAQMNLGSMDIQNLEVHMGVGELKLDLRGMPKRDENVEVHGGVGEATIYVPNNVGISATAKGGIGDISVEGLEKRDDRWVNKAYDNAPVRIRLDVRGGVGDIHLIAQ